MNQESLHEALSRTTQASDRKFMVGGGAVLGANTACGNAIGSPQLRERTSIQTEVAMLRAELANLDEVTVEILAILAPVLDEESSNIVRRVVDEREDKGAKLEETGSPLRAQLRDMVKQLGNRAAMWGEIKKHIEL